MPRSLGERRRDRRALGKLGRHTSIALATMIVAAGCIGCSPAASTSADDDVDARSLPVINGSQLQAFVSDSELPVLVEFGVDFNCPRCQQVKPEVLQLSERLMRQTRVVRVDYSANAALVASLGGTICPTYVLFDDGQPVLTLNYPVSMDLLEGEVLAATAVD